MPKGIYLHKKGWHLSEETKRKLSEAKKGDKNPTKRVEVRKKISEANKKRFSSEEARKKMSEVMKGRLPWNTGKHLTEKQKRKMIGKHHTEETKEKIRQTLKKIYLSPEARKRLGENSKGKKHSEETKRKIREHSPHYWLGKHFPKERNKKLSEDRMGEKNQAWKGGITPENQRIRGSIEFSLWRESVFARDNWTCQKCKVRGGKLVAHHIQNFAQYPELRFAIDNGITLCNECHKEFHKKFGFRSNTKEQLAEFLL